MSRWLFVSVLALSTLATPAAGETPQARLTETRVTDVSAPRRVLILHGERLELPGSAAVDGSIRAALAAAAGAGGPIDVYSESLDIARFAGEDHRRHYRDFLSRRYADKPVDVMITLGEATLDFLAQYRDTLFPNALVVASQSRAATPPRSRWVTSVVAGSSMRPSFELILKLHPDTQRVVIVAGASQTDRLWAERAQRDVREVAPTLEIIDLGDALTIANILQAVASQPPHTVIFYLHILRDAAGQLFVPRTILDSIARVANAPIYGRYDTFIGHGIVGGHVYSFEALGARLAEIALRLLRGEQPLNVAPVESAADVHMFDWRQLRRWRIDEGLLPAGSVVRFREPSAWELYSWRIVGTLALLTVQSALIVGLVVSRARRRRAEGEARQQREELAHVLRVTTLGELTTSLAHEINQPLTAIATNAQAAGGLLDVKSPPRGEIAKILTDIGSDAKRAAQIIHRLRAFFRKEPTVAVAVDITTLIEEVIGLLRADVDRRRITVRVAAAEALPPVFGDPIQLQQVFLNVLVNACEAIESTEVGPRAILIEIRRPGPKHLAIAIQDTGIGVKESELERIFDHFVTSKPSGLGMGLAISRSIVRAHGGRLWATANSDRGVTLHVVLPVRQPPPPERPKERNRPPPQHPLPTRQP